MKLKNKKAQEVTGENRELMYIIVAIIILAVILGFLWKTGIFKQLGDAIRNLIHSGGSGYT